MTELCIAVINPSKNFYDGVVGGRIWSHGRDMTKSTSMRSADAQIIPIEQGIQARERLEEQDELIKHCKGCDGWVFDAEVCPRCN